jgi:hypothetical protein
MHTLDPQLVGPWRLTLSVLTSLFFKGKTLEFLVGFMGGLNYGEAQVEQPPFPLLGA